MRSPPVVCRSTSAIAGWLLIFTSTSPGLQFGILSGIIFFCCPFSGTGFSRCSCYAAVRIGCLNSSFGNPYMYGLVFYNMSICDLV